MPISGINSFAPLMIRIIISSTALFYVYIRDTLPIAIESIMTCTFSIARVHLYIHQCERTTCAFAENGKKFDEHNWNCLDLRTFGHCWWLRLHFSFVNCVKNTVGIHSVRYRYIESLIMYTTNRLTNETKKKEKKKKTRESESFLLLHQATLINEITTNEHNYILIICGIHRMAQLQNKQLHR